MVDQSPKEELANTLTHGLGIVLGLLGIPLMLYTAATGGGALEIWGVSIFCVSLMMVYGSSTLYHAINNPRWKDRLQLMDHISIYYLIAGTYTPFLLMYMEGDARVISLLVVWGIALLGTIYKLFFLGRWKYLSTALYLGMGWMFVFFGGPILEGLSTAGIVWLVIGGLSYTVGVIFYVRKSMRFQHAIWHLFVLLGTGSHFIAVMVALPG